VVQGWQSSRGALWRVNRAQGKAQRQGGKSSEGIISLGFHILTALFNSVFFLFPGLFTFKAVQ